MPTARTSESHPLRITAMTLGDGRGRIGFSQCPGRIDRYAISGPWKRDLDTDLDAIQRWGATAVVSLITHEEIAYLKVHDLPRAVRDRHMEWWHAPIPDGEAPEQDFEHAWKATGESIRNREAEQLGVAERILLAERVSESDFRLYASAADICLNLRYPSAGETSATLLRLLAAGRAVMATDQMRELDYPRHRRRPNEPRRRRGRSLL